jgi:hypothetical protein
MFTDQFSPDLYNELTGPDEAYEVVQSHDDFETFLEQFGALTGSPALQDQVGVFLLHRHFDVGNDCRMIEEPLILDDGRPALVTAPTRAKGGAPARWRLGHDGAFSPLEYTRDPGAFYTSERLVANHTVAAHYASMLRDFRARKRARPVRRSPRAPSGKRRRCSFRGDLRGRERRDFRTSRSESRRNPNGLDPGRPQRMHPALQFELFAARGCRAWHCSQRTTRWISPPKNFDSYLRLPAEEQRRRSSCKTGVRLSCPEPPLLKLTTPTRSDAQTDMRVVVT